jgi:hypothetical protein
MNMSQQQIRWLLLALASGAIGLIIVRRRRQIVAALPEQFSQQAERFVIPWPSLDRSGAQTPVATEPDAADGTTVEAETVETEEPEDEDSMRRKVSSGNRISFRGKRYGPLPEALVGEYVEVETRDGKLFILHNSTPIATFNLTS